MTSPNRLKLATRDSSKMEGWGGGECGKSAAGLFNCLIVKPLFLWIMKDLLNIYVHAKRACDSYAIPLFVCQKIIVFFVLNVGTIPGIILGALAVFPN